MPDTLSQTKAIYEKAARPAGYRRARLLRTKASRSASRSTVVTPIVATTTSSPSRVSLGKQQLLQLKIRLASTKELNQIFMLCLRHSDRQHSRNVAFGIENNRRSKY
jgi:hypothetical protein